MRPFLLLSLLAACSSDKDGDSGGVVFTDADGDGYGADDDCNDDDSAVNPGAAEACNEVDDDCDGATDEDVLSTWYADADGDGWGDEGAASEACEAPSGSAADPGDCDDGDAAVNPDAAETCNDVDDDCDGEIDEEGADTWYADVDGDGYGDPASTSTACEPPADFVEDDTDCDDGDATVHPAAVEVCNDLDDDCDEQVDEDALSTWYVDVDGDGWGDAGKSAASCLQPSGYVDDGTDCDDADAAISPGAVDECEDGIDQDCNGLDRTCRLEGTHSASTAHAILLGQPDELAGSRVSGAGDVDGDGVDDLWVGLYGYGPGGSDYSGGVALVLGPVSGLHDIVDVAVGTVYGASSSHYAGWDFRGGDDLDGDGVPDVAIGAYGADGGYGAGYFVSGVDMSGDLSLADATGVVTSGGATSNLAYDLDTSPDLTGDGIGDIILGSYGSGSDSYRGHAWIMAGPMSGALTLSDAAAIVDGDSALDLAGNGVGGVGDTNGDGAPDLLVGAHGDDGAGAAAGAAGLFYGPLSGNVAMADADRTVEGENPGDEMSRNTVGGRGDVDGDGLDDVLIGSQFNSTYGTYAGSLYLLLGSTTATGTLNAIDTAAQIYGVVDYDFMGRGFDLGDLDGDGFADLIVSAYAEDTAGAEAGAVYVYYGPVTGSMVGTDAETTLLGVDANDYFGFMPAVVGDTDGDGQDDLLVGAWFDSDGGTNAGAAYLFP
jgi:Putative metal-binding motif/FG-GAP repeat